MQAQSLKFAAVAKKVKTIIALNILFNICAVIVLLYIINNKSVYFETAIWRAMFTAGCWVIVSFIFSVILKIKSKTGVNSKILLNFIQAYLILLSVLFICIILLLGSYVLVFTVRNTLMRIILLAVFWIVVNLIFSVLFKITNKKNNKRQTSAAFINIYLMFVAVFVLCLFFLIGASFWPVISPVLIVIECVGFVAGFILPFIIFAIGFTERLQVAANLSHPEI